MTSETTRRHSKPITVVVLVIAAIILFGGGWLIGQLGVDPSRHEGSAAGAPLAEADRAIVWTCTMHLQIRAREPGDCPVCGMELITAATDLRLSATARALAQVAVVPVERRWVARQVRLVGSIEYDETKLRTITARVGGRLDRLYVDYTGISVSKGDHMVWMYSPEILAAEAELIESIKAVAAAEDSTLELVRKSARATLAATRDKLRLWGLTPEQVAEIEARGEPSDHIQINAPIGGVVIQKNAEEGMYVQTGTPIYRIADLSKVWVKIDAYESDLPWLRYGQEVTFTSDSLPGETIVGRIAFIDPVVTVKTRTVKIRANVSNDDGRLKPGMFVRAVVESGLAAGGRTLDANLAGKWVSPMHPEIVRNEPGPCPVCGMALVKAEDLGLVTAAAPPELAPLVIPATAALRTGRRAIVYVQNPDDPSRYEGREVVLGPRAGDFFLVQSGVEAGELVVINGNFKIDSARQILAQPSMMNPSEPAAGAADSALSPATKRLEGSHHEGSHHEGSHKDE
jgi:Cu(I)/Ag(I) efflux system membrane fusion protein